MASDPTATHRLWLDYSYRGQNHSVQLRYSTETAAVAAAGVWSAVLTANAAAFYEGCTFSGARVARAGDNVSNPVPFDIVVGTQGPNGALAYAGLSYSFVGRSPDGAKCRWFWYGAYSGTDLEPDFRYQAGESTLLDAFLTDFKDAAAETDLRTIGGTVPVIYNYINVSLNAYRQRKARSSVSG